MKKENDLIPDFYYNSFCEIDFDYLANKGYTNLIVDVDNTISWNRKPEAYKDAAEIINSLKERKPSFKICLVSNIIFGKKREERVSSIAEKLGVEYVTAKFWDRKPHPAPFLKAMQLLGSVPENTAVIGDQIFTDILGANRLGLFSILVKPLGDDHWANKLVGTRKKEKTVIKKLGIELTLKNS